MKRVLPICLLVAGVASSQPKTAIQTSGEEVLVDVVVRDKKGQAIKNLDRDAFTIFDQGVPRQIASFRLIRGTEAVVTPSNGAGATQKLDPFRQIRLVTLIFDRLSQGERSVVRQAALDLLKAGFPPNVYMSVFTLGNQLQAIQAFTNRRDLLTAAVEKATSRPSNEFAGDSEAMRSEVERILGPNVTGNQDAITRLGQFTNNVTDAFGGMEAIMARSMVEMISFSERSEMAYAGRSTIWALLAAVRGQSQLPGRKALIYFSEGFAIPQGAEEEFRAVISAANRNNVTFYPIDARGLISSSSAGGQLPGASTGMNAKATEGLSAAAAASANNTNLGASGLGGMATPKTEIILSDDLYIDANRMNTQDTLAILADETGGFLTANTNDFRAPLRRVMEELDTYYELTYIPHIDNYDGRFRRIDVKVNNNDLTVQSRAGYFALPPDMLKASGLNSYEVPLLRTLSDKPYNPALPFESGAMHFRGEGNMETCGVLVDMALNNISLREKRSGDSLTGGLAYLALIKDVKGTVVKKLEGEMPVDLTREQVPAFKQGRFTDVEYVDLPSGYYTVEVAVLDRESGRSSARRSAIFIPKRTGHLAMSSVALIRKWRPKEPDADADDPFVIGDKSVTPSLLPRINKSVSNALPFYVIVYPSKHTTDAPRISVEFDRDGQIKRVAAVTMGAPDAQGRIQYVATAPIDQFDPGHYAVRFLVSQGTETAEEDLAINLQP